MKHIVNNNNPLNDSYNTNLINLSDKYSENLNVIYPKYYRKNSYIFPIFLKKFRNAYDLDFRTIHPEKPIDKSKIINYKFNPHFKRSISNKEIFRITNGLNDYTDKNNSLISNENFSLNPKKILLEEKNAYNKPYSQSSIKFFKHQQIREIVKRSYFFDKIIDAKIKRYALNNFSNFENEKNDDSKDIESYNKKENVFDRKRLMSKIPKLRDYLKYLIKKRNKERERNIFKESEEEDSNVKLPKMINIKKDKFKFKLFKDDNGEIKDLSKPSNNKIKMTSDRIRDMKLMEKLNKIKEKEFVESLKLILHDFN